MRHRFLIVSFILLSCPSAIAHPDSLGESIPPLDEAFLHSSIWDDGKAEVAFYKIVLGGGERPRPSGSGRGYTAVSVLVKHDYNPAARRKARENDDSRVAAFQCAQLFEVLGMYKHSKIFNAAQDDLRPLEQVWTNISWEGTCYVEMVLHEGSLTSLQRCGFDWQDTTWPYERGSFAAPQIPLVIRAIDFTSSRAQRFRVALPEGRFTGAVATIEAEEPLEILPGAIRAQRIRVRYDEMIGYPGGLWNFVAREEVYWRSTQPHRQIVKIESVPAPGELSYAITLIEEKRVRWWEETDLLSQFERIEKLP